MTITILEDHKSELEHLCSLLHNWSTTKNIELELHTFASGENYFQNRRTSENSNIIFLDIQMCKITGLDVAKKLRQEGYIGAIVFLTSFREYVFNGYEVHALNYLLKPVKEKQLFFCLDEVAKDLDNNSHIYRNKNDIIQIPYKNILCFSASLHYIDILTIDNTYSQYSTLTKIIEYLPIEFIRVHRSYIVNMAHIYKISGNIITLSNNKIVPIGRSYSQAVQNSFATYSDRLN